MLLRINWIEVPINALLSYCYSNIMEVTEKKVLILANTILANAGLEQELSTTKQCNSTIFSALYNKLLHVPTATLSKSTRESVRCQTVINSLSKLLPPEISLSHIKGRDIANGDLLAIKNLLEVFGVLFQLDCADSTTDDSNLLSEEGIKVVNEVLQEELTVQPPIVIPSAPKTCIPSTPPTHDCLDPPLHQSTPHQGPKSRLPENKLVKEDTISKELDIPALSISSLSSSFTSHSICVSPSLSRPLSDSSTNGPTPQPDNITLTETPERTKNDYHTSCDHCLNQHSTSCRDQHSPKESVGRDQCLDFDKDRLKSSNIPSQSHNEILKKLYHNYLNTMVRHSKKKPTSKHKGKHSPIIPSHIKGSVVKPQPTGPLISAVQEAFPGAHSSPATERRLWQQQARQLKSQTMCLHPRTNPTHKKIEEMHQRQKSLLTLLNKELNHTQKMHAIAEQRQHERLLKLSLQNHRQATARTRRYFNDYEITIRNKLQKRRTKEEQVYRLAFEECLRIQTENIREMKQYAKEKQEVVAKQHQDRLQSLETFYHDRLAMIAEAIEKEQKEAQVRERAQQQATSKSERELRQYMESEITRLWSGLDDWEKDNIHYRELDKELLKEKLTKI